MGIKHLDSAHLSSKGTVSYVQEHDCAWRWLRKDFNEILVGKVGSGTKVSNWNGKYQLVIYKLFIHDSGNVSVLCLDHLAENFKSH